MTMRRLFCLSLFLAGCGNADIIAPEALAIADTYPGNGSLVAALETKVAIAFSADVDENTLSQAITLEETSDGGAPIRAIAVRFQRYDALFFTATFESDPLPAGSTFLLTIRASALRAKNGSELAADVRRAFRTLEP
jgi:hypothetical protein